MPSGVRTAVSFKTRDSTWTDKNGVTHRLVGHDRVACDPHNKHPRRISGQTPWKRPDCIDCIGFEASGPSRTVFWAILQEADLEET